jgi:glutamine synthetase
MVRGHRHNKINKDTPTVVKTNITTFVEYVWIGGGNNALRGKTKVVNGEVNAVSDLSDWNFDGSSTEQAQGTDSEVIIKPRALFNDPFRGLHHKIVLCDTYSPKGDALPNNHRQWANEIFNQKLGEEPWFGLEQEYFLMDPKTNLPLGFGEEKSQGQFYCSAGAENAFGRNIVEQHLTACVHAGIKISGVNAEVAPGQWEFQIGPCVGIEQGDHLWMARYLLQRVAEIYKVSVDIEPKPIKGDWNGSGCHTNYSTKNMREGTDSNTGLDYINDAIDKLSLKHDAHMAVYGSGNEQRMTGEHETASFDKFSSGIANRGASVRIGNENYNNQKGYFEDRRPSSNCDPYLVTGIIFRTTCLE